DRRVVLVIRAIGFGDLGREPLELRGGFALRKLVDVLGRRSALRFAAHRASLSACTTAIAEPAMQCFMDNGEGARRTARAYRQGRCCSSMSVLKERSSQL